MWTIDDLEDELIEDIRCARCGKMVKVDDHNTVVDFTGGDVCGALGGNEPHVIGDYDPPRCEMDVENGVCLTPMTVFDKCRNEGNHL